MRFFCNLNIKKKVSTQFLSYDNGHLINVNA